jgi:hypothetical protein
VIETILWLGLIFVSPYSFEVKNGIATEAVIGTSFLDKQDRTALNAGFRLSYLDPDEKDAVITGEIQMLSQTVFTGSNYDTPRQKFMGDLSVAFYEFYHPYAFRLLLGPCAEWRTSKLNYGASIRAGLGYYTKEDFSFFADIGGRTILRTAADSMPYDLSFSIQKIF